MKQQKEMSTALRDCLQQFFTQEIASALFRGVTYTLTFNDDTVKNTAYLSLKDKLMDEGFVYSKYMRVFKLCNGYIFDMNLAVAQKLGKLTIESVLGPEEKLSQDDIIRLSHMPLERINNDAEKLARLCVNEMKKGKNEVAVALFNKNSGSEIKFNAVGTDGVRYLLNYKAFCLRHTDLEMVNRKYLVKNAIRIKEIQPCEILPTKTGVRYILYLERIAPNITIKG